MKSWRHRWHLATSFMFCAMAVIVGTLLYPFVLLFFGVLALFWPPRKVAERNADSGPSTPPQRSGA